MDQLVDEEALVVPVREVGALMRPSGLRPAQRRELDDKKRATILTDIQKEMALQMPSIPWPGAANGFSVAWPQLANYGVFRAPTDFESVIWTRYWYDESKKPA